MVSFKCKKVEENSKTLGEVLVEARKEKEVTLVKVERKIHVQKKYLEALERGDYSIFPGQVYGRNFLRAYASFLDLDMGRLTALFDKEYDSHHRFNGSHQEPIVDFKPRSRKSSFIIFPKVAKSILVLAVVVVLVGYLSFKVKNIISPPILIIRSPADNLITEGTHVQVVGQTEKEVELTINNEEVLIGNDGDFSKTINLKDGLNTIEVIACKKHSRENVVERHVLAVKNRDKEETLSN